MRAAVWFADFMCGGVPEVEADLQWLRQRALSWTGRPLAEGEEDFRRFPEFVSRITEVSRGSGRWSPPWLTLCRPRGP